MTRFVIGIVLATLWAVATVCNVQMIVSGPQKIELSPSSWRLGFTVIELFATLILLLPAIFLIRSGVKSLNKKGCEQVGPANGAPRRR